MALFIGDYTCKVDPKGRILFPSAFKKQMDAASDEHFVIKKDIFEQCLVLYPFKEWERQNEIIRNRLNPYNREHNRFLRAFFKGSAEVFLDGNSRILIPKRLLESADIQKDAVLAGQDGKIEIWSKELYEAGGLNEDEFATLAEKILGNTNNTEQ